MTTYQVGDTPPPYTFGQPACDDVKPGDGRHCSLDRDHGGDQHVAAWRGKVTAVWPREPEVPDAPALPKPAAGLVAAVLAARTAYVSTPAGKSEDGDLTAVEIAAGAAWIADHLDALAEQYVALAAAEENPTAATLLRIHDEWVRQAADEVRAVGGVQR